MDSPAVLMEIATTCDNILSIRDVYNLVTAVSIPADDSDSATLLFLRRLAVYLFKRQDISQIQFRPDAIESLNTLMTNNQHLSWLVSRLSDIEISHILCLAFLLGIPTNVIRVLRGYMSPGAHRVFARKWMEAGFTENADINFIENVLFPGILADDTADNLQIALEPIHGKRPFGSAYDELYERYLDVVAAQFPSSWQTWIRSDAASDVFDAIGYRFGPEWFHVASVIHGPLAHEDVTSEAIVFAAVYDIRYTSYFLYSKQLITTEEYDVLQADPNSDASAKTMHSVISRMPSNLVRCFVVSVIVAFHDTEYEPFVKSVIRAYFRDNARHRRFYVQLSEFFAMRRSEDSLELLKFVAVVATSHNQRPTHIAIAA